MSTYEPGQVAVATVRGVPKVRVIRDGHKDAWLSGAIIDGFQWHLERTQVTDIRPLVVLDLDEHLSAGGFDWPAIVGVLRAPGDSGRYTREAIADQIEQQTKPPRIPEPGLWGVVEASVGPDGRYKFVRFNDSSWMCTADSSTYPWAGLIDPVLVRPGIEDES
jgi:hypothetical protein